MPLSRRALRDFKSEPDRFPHNAGAKCAPDLKGRRARRTHLRAYHWQTTTLRSQAIIETLAEKPQTRKFKVEFDATAKSHRAH